MGKVNVLEYDFDGATQKELLRDFGRNGNINVAGLIRSIILKELEVCKTEEKETRTLRDFWYSNIKSVLARAEGEDKAIQPNWGRKRSQQLSAVLSQMVLDGECSYSDLYMEDQSRQRNNLDQWSRPVYDEIFIFVEKDASFFKIKNVSEVYRIGLVSGKGFDATMAIELLTKNIDPGKEYKILMLTDYDFYGFEIAQDWSRRCMKLGLKVDVERIGLLPDQTTKKNIERNKYPIVAKTPRQKQWCREYGVNGKFGLELQAISPREIRTVLVEKLMDICPEEDLYDYLREKSLNEVPSDSVKRLLDFYTESLRKILEEAVNKECFKDPKERIWKKNFDNREDIPEGTLPQMAINNEEWLEMDNESLIEKVMKRVQKKVKTGKIKISLNGG